MFRHRAKLFKVLGFTVSVDATWILLAFLITWTLADGLFPQFYPGLSTTTYWWMGLAGALGLFFSIIFHELSHSLVARQHGIAMKGITLFIFGGVAEMREEPSSPKAEFFMAVVGPIASIVLSFLFYGISLMGQTFLNIPVPILGIFYYLAWINFILAVFNSVPAFPLDGGRVLRSVLWAWKNDFRKATKIVTRIGSGFGVALMIIGLLNILGGYFIGGFWYILIGWFLRGAAQMSYQQLLMKYALENQHVKRFMRKDVITVPAKTSVADLVEKYVYEHHYKMFPVTQDDVLLGCVTIQNIKEVPRDLWGVTEVKTIVRKCTDENTVSPETEVLRALQMMKETENSRLMVVDQNALAGIVSLKDLLQFLDLKLALEGDETTTPYFAE